MWRAVIGRLKRIRASIKGRIEGYRQHLPCYIVDGANWAIRSDGEYITRGIKAQFGVDCQLVTDARFLYRQVVHFGSQYLFTGGGYRVVHPSNRVVVTFFHGDASDPAFAPAVSVLQREIGRVSRVIVSCRLMAARMETWGIPDDKVTLIPIGVDLDIFRPLLSGQRDAMRAQLGIRPEHVVVGSFQKDGVGWDEGLEPKMIKGPDVFLQVIARLRKGVPVFVLLTGPARGYVRRGLEQMGVPYRHVFLSSYAEMVPYYYPLDLYLVTSREEGGPKAVMESMATGVPLVSTRVGMAADLIQDGVNGFLCEIEDVESLAARALEVIGNEDVRERFRSNGYRSVEDCDFSVVARRHYEEVYKPLLQVL
jgi:glycosyltransferase involved in cell wall biosynthesis